MSELCGVTMRYGAPFTASHNVATVLGHSYRLIVNPAVYNGAVSDVPYQGARALTIHLVVLFHEEKGVVVGVAVEMDVGSANRWPRRVNESRTATYSTRQYHLYRSTRGCL